MARLLLLAVLWPFWGALPVEAAQDAVLWERWLRFVPGAMEKIDHRRFETFLMHHLRQGPDGMGEIAYDEVTEKGKAVLDDYLKELSEVEISRYDRPEQMAFWLNLYNALTIATIVDHYPLSSLRDIQKTKGVAGPGAWDLQLLAVEGAPLSMNDIEHRILRPIFQDPRIHYALSCGALSCPPLSPMPFNGDELEAQLTAAAMGYVNDPDSVAVEGERLVISSLYRWYLDDFGGTELDVIRHLMAYAEPELAMKLQAFDRFHGDAFNWRLRDASRQSKTP